MSQALALREYLVEAGHSVDTVFLGTGTPEKVPDYFREAFPDDLRIFRSPAFLRTPNKKGIYVGRTLLFNLLFAPGYLREVAGIRREIRSRKPDMVFNFYELLGALAMRKMDPEIRRIGLGHHFYLHLNRTNFRLRPRWHRWLLGMHSRMIMRSCDRVLALSHAKEEGSEEIRVIPPLLRQEFRQMKYIPGDRYLVYLLQEGFLYDLVQLARQVPDFRADVFTSLKPAMALPEGMRLHSFDAGKFGKFMASCKGLIATAGFDTIAEAAYLGIPLAVVPSRNHYEQRCNAAEILARGIGVSGSHISKELLDSMHAPDSGSYRLWVEEAGELLIDDTEK